MTPFQVLWCILADDVLGWEIVLKISSFPLRLRLSAEYSFFGQHPRRQKRFIYKIIQKINCGGTSLKATGPLALLNDSFLSSE